MEELVLDAEPIAEFLKELAAPPSRAFLKMFFIDNFCHIQTTPLSGLQRFLPRGGLVVETEMKHTIIFLGAGICDIVADSE